MARSFSLQMLSRQTQSQPLTEMTEGGDSSTPDPDEPDVGPEVRSEYESMASSKEEVPEEYIPKAIMFNLAGMLNFGMSDISVWPPSEFK